MLEKDELILGLKTIGFSESEARIYLAILELKEALPGSLAKRLGLKRPTVYVTLERLEGKGMIYSIKKNGYLRYCVKSPQDFIKEELEKSANIQSSLENLSDGLLKLHSLYDRKEEKIELSVFKGAEALKQMKKNIRAFNGKVENHEHMGSEIIIYGEKVVLLSGEDEIGIVIQSKEIVKSQKAVLGNMQKKN